jgi:acyl-CoA dehydrogenase
VSSSSSDGAWELPQEFRQMQQTARRFMRERVVPAEAPLPHDAYALPDDVLKPLQEEARKLGFWNVESPAEWGGAGLNLLGQAVVAEESSQCKMGLYIPACHAFKRDLPWPQGPDREVRGSDDGGRRKDLRGDLRAERRLGSRPCHSDARREER